MDRLLPVTTTDDIPVEYRGGPIGRLLEYHNLARPFDDYERAELLIGMCMDNRNQLCIPNNFAFILRAGGANLRYSEFKVSFAIGVGEIRHLALIGHNKCGMVNLVSRREQFVQGLVKHAGWEPEKAQEHFLNFAPIFEIDNEIDFVFGEVRRLRHRYPKISIAPMHYSVDDNRLYLVREE